MPSDPTFAPGVRFSRTDAAALLLFAGAAAGLTAVEPWLGVAAGFVAGNYFLFCNVVRASRGPELLWAGLFVTLAGLATDGSVGWPAALAVASAGTAAVVGAEVRRPSYHGAGWRRLNPTLPDWWRARRAAGL